MSMSRLLGMGKSSGKNAEDYPQKLSTQHFYVTQIYLIVPGEGSAKSLSRKV